MTVDNTVNAENVGKATEEIRSALEHGASGLLDRVRNVLEQLETAFNEPSDIGVQSQLNQLWTGWDDVANHPGDTASRTQLLERAATLANSFNSLGNSMTALRSSTISELGSMVADVNAKAATIADRVLFLADGLIVRDLGRADEEYILETVKELSLT